MTYWAHSDPSGLPSSHPEARWQPLAEHLVNVSALARSLARHAAPDDEVFQDSAAECGLLHDFGKYTACFQKMINGGGGRCQHAAHGATLAMIGASPDGSPPQHSHVAFAIAGHHGGMPDPVGGESSLTERVKKFTGEARGLVSRAVEDCAELKALFGRPLDPPDKEIAGRFDLYTRMLFSCLVDADRLDSAGREIIQAPLDAKGRLAALMASVERLAAHHPETAVGKARAEILRDCLNAAEFPERLLSLSAPTGGGKTLAAMAFALRRAAIYPERYRRVIVVIPYLSITEQNAEVYSRIFGPDGVLEHHSGAFERLAARRSKDEGKDRFVPTGDGSDEIYEPPKRRSETENWDAPCIVTTSVRFFESLFSNRPSDLRRVHNIARSIVILDEVQTIPRRLLAPLLAMIQELSRNWGCTFVFSTATLPAFEQRIPKPQDPRWAPGTIREIVQRQGELRKTLKRVQVEWRIDAPTSWAALAGEMLSNPQALAVVNVRDHAAALFDELAAQATERGVDAEAVIHLSTRMCPAHRLAVIETIKRRVRDQLPCWVASTQLVEAGVDLDFPAVFRAIAPLDSIMQAAGRADREGLRTAAIGSPAGRVVVFIPEDNRMPPNEYEEAAGLAQGIARDGILRGRTVQTDCAEGMLEYFERYYGVHPKQLGSDLEELRQNGRFAELGEQFEMIDSRTRDVFIPFDEAARRAIAELRAIGQLTGDLRRRLQRYVVGLYPGEFFKARSVLEQIRPPSEIWVAAEAAYSQAKGLRFEVAPEDLYVG